MTFGTRFSERPSLRSAGARVDRVSRGDHQRVDRARARSPRPAPRSAPGAARGVGGDRRAVRRRCAPTLPSAALIAAAERVDRRRLPAPGDHQRARRGCARGRAATRDEPLRVPARRRRAPSGRAAPSAAEPRADSIGARAPRRSAATSPAAHAQAVIGHRAGDRQGRLDDVEPVHVAAPGSRRAANSRASARLLGPVAEEVGVEREDHRRPRPRSWRGCERPAEGELRALDRAVGGDRRVADELGACGNRSRMRRAQIGRAAARPSGSTRKRRPAPPSPPALAPRAPARRRKRRQAIGVAAAARAALARSSS